MRSAIGNSEESRCQLQSQLQPEPRSDPIGEFVISKLELSTYLSVINLFRCLVLEKSKHLPINNYLISLTTRWHAVQSVFRLCPTPVSSFPGIK